MSHTWAGISSTTIRRSPCQTFVLTTSPCVSFSQRGQGNGPPGRLFIPHLSGMPRSPGVQGSSAKTFLALYILANSLSPSPRELLNRVHNLNLVRYHPQVHVSAIGRRPIRVCDPPQLGRGQSHRRHSHDMPREVVGPVAVADTHELARLLHRGDEGGLVKGLPRPG